MVLGMWGEKKKELAEAAALLLGVSFDFPFVKSCCLVFLLISPLLNHPDC